MLRRPLRFSDDIGFQMSQLRPMRDLRHEKRVFVRINELFRDQPLRHAFGLQVLGTLLALQIEAVGEPPQEQHAKDVFLVLRRIHVPRKSSYALSSSDASEFGHQVPIATRPNIFGDDISASLDELPTLLTSG